MKVQWRRGSVYRAVSSFLPPPWLPFSPTHSFLPSFCSLCQEGTKTTPWSYAEAPLLSDHQSNVQTPVVEVPFQIWLQALPKKVCTLPEFCCESQCVPFIFSPVTNTYFNILASKHSSLPCYCVCVYLQVSVHMHNMAQVTHPAMLKCSLERPIIYSYLYLFVSFEFNKSYPFY